MNQSQECRAFTQKHNGLANRIITDVRISEAFDPKNQPAKPNLFDTKALWDTGATHSVITEATAKSLGLFPTGKSLVHHAGGKGDFNTYVVNFFLPNRVAIIGVRVTGAPHLENCGAIIGMDIIMGGDMSISNHNGQTWFTFRWPSYGAVDYVADFDVMSIGMSKTKVIPKPVITPQQVASLPKVGRNDMCPCGSGRKYKKCHGSVI